MATLLGRTAKRRDSQGTASSGSSSLQETTKNTKDGRGLTGFLSRFRHTEKERKPRRVQDGATYQNRNGPSGDYGNQGFVEDPYAIEMALGDPTYW